MMSLIRENICFHSLIHIQTICRNKKLSIYTKIYFFEIILFRMIQNEIIKLNKVTLLSVEPYNMGIWKNVYSCVQVAICT